LILQTAGGTVLEQAIDAYPHPAPLRQIPLRFAKCDQLLGLAILADDQVHFLQRLQLSLMAREPSRALFQVPSFRVDM